MIRLRDNAGRSYWVNERPLAPPEDIVCFRCYFCRGEIYVGDSYYAVDDKIICPYCLGRFAKQYFSDRARRAR